MQPATKVPAAQSAAPPQALKDVKAFTTHLEAAEKIFSTFESASTSDKSQFRTELELAYAECTKITKASNGKDLSADLLKQFSRLMFLQGRALFENDKPAAYFFFQAAYMSQPINNCAKDLLNATMINELFASSSLPEVQTHLKTRHDSDTLPDMFHWLTTRSKPFAGTADKDRVNEALRSATTLRMIGESLEEVPNYNTITPENIKRFTLLATHARFALQYVASHPQMKEEQHTYYHERAELQFGIEHFIHRLKGTKPPYNEYMGQAIAQIEEACKFAPSPRMKWIQIQVLYRSALQTDAYRDRNPSLDHSELLKICFEDLKKGCIYADQWPECDPVLKYKLLSSRIYYAYTNEQTGHPLVTSSELQQWCGDLIKYTLSAKLGDIKLAVAYRDAARYALVMKDVAKASEYVLAMQAICLKDTFQKDNSPDAEVIKKEMPSYIDSLVGQLDEKIREAMDALESGSTDPKPSLVQAWVCDQSTLLEPTKFENLDNFYRYCNLFRFAIFQKDYKSAVAHIKTLEQFCTKFGATTDVKEQREYVDGYRDTLTILLGDKVNEAVTALENGATDPKASIVQLWVCDLSNLLEPIKLDSLANFNGYCHLLRFAFFQKDYKSAVGHLKTLEQLCAKFGTSENVSKQLGFVDHYRETLKIRLKEVVEKSNTATGGKLVADKTTTTNITGLQRDINDILPLLEILEFKEHTDINYYINVIHCLIFLKDYKRANENIEAALKASDKFKAKPEFADLLDHINIFQKIVSANLLPPTKVIAATPTTQPASATATTAVATGNQKVEVPAKPTPTPSATTPSAVSAAIQKFNLAAQPTPTPSVVKTTPLSACNQKIFDALNALEAGNATTKLAEVEKWVAELLPLLEPVKLESLKRVYNYFNVVRFYILKKDFVRAEQYLKITDQICDKFAQKEKVDEPRSYISAYRDVIKAAQTGSAPPTPVASPTATPKSVDTPSSLGSYATTPTTYAATKAATAAAAAAFATTTATATTLPSPKVVVPSTPSSVAPTPSSRVSAATPTAQPTPSTPVSTVATPLARSATISTPRSVSAPVTPRTGLASTHKVTRSCADLALAMVIVTAVSAVFIAIGVVKGGVLLLAGGAISAGMGALLLLRWHYQRDKGLSSNPHLIFALIYPVSVSVASLAATIFNPIPAAIVGAVSLLTAGGAIYKGETAA